MLLLCNYKKSIMELSIINIGNSKGIRLSKTILEKYNIQDKIELISETFTENTSKATQKVAFLFLLKYLLRCKFSYLF